MGRATELYDFWFREFVNKGEVSPARVGAPLFNGYFFSSILQVTQTYSFSKVLSLVIFLNVLICLIIKFDIDGPQ